MHHPCPPAGESKDYVYPNQRATTCWYHVSCGITCTACFTLNSLLAYRGFAGGLCGPAAPLHPLLQPAPPSPDLPHLTALSRLLQDHALHITLDNAYAGVAGMHHCEGRVPEPDPRCFLSDSISGHILSSRHIFALGQVAQRATCIACVICVTCATCLQVST